MRRWKAWIVGALALTGLAAAPEMAQARSTPVPDLLPITGTATPSSSGTVAPTCQYGYYHPGWRRHHGWRRHYGWRRPYYGYRRYGYRRPYYGYRRHWRHRYYRPIGFYHRPWGYHRAYYGYHRPWRHHYGW